MPTILLHHASPAPANLLVAAAVDASGNLTSVSNWGPVHVDLGAYTERRRAYTSYSSGYTAGVAAVDRRPAPAGPHGRRRGRDHQGVP